MKKSLISSLVALACTVTLLTGCGETNPADEIESYSIDSLMYWDDEVNYDEEEGEYIGGSAYHGRKVKIEDAGVVLGYKDFMYIQQSEGTSVGDLRQIQVRNPNIDFTQYEYNSEVTVVGTVGYEDGRIVIDDAEVTVTDTNESGDGAYVFYWPHMDRQSLQNFGTYQLSGVMVSTAMQLATKPETITTDKETIVKVVFPGESLDYTNPLNKLTMDYVIPAGLPEKEVTALNEMFANTKVGDGFDSLGVLHMINKKWEYLAIPGVSSNERYNYTKEIKGIYTTHEDLVNSYFKTHVKEYALIPSLEFVDPDLGDGNLVYSYKIDEKYFNASTEYRLLVTAYTFYPKEFYNYIRFFFADFQENEDYTCIDLTDQGRSIVQLVKSNKESGKEEMIITCMRGIKGFCTFEIKCATPIEPIKSAEFKSFAEAILTLEDFAESYASKTENDVRFVKQANVFDSSLVDIKTVLAEGQNVSDYYVSRKKEIVYKPHKLQAAHELLQFRFNDILDKDTLDTIKDAYIAKLKEIGFVECTNVGFKTHPHGLYNPASGEWITLNTILTGVAHNGDTIDGEVVTKDFGYIELFVDAVDYEVHSAIKDTLKTPEAGK